MGERNGVRSEKRRGATAFFVCMFFLFFRHASFPFFLSLSSSIFLPFLSFSFPYLLSFSFFSSSSWPHSCEWSRSQPTYLHTYIHIYKKANSVQERANLYVYVYVYISSRTWPFFNTLMLLCGNQTIRHKPPPFFSSFLSLRSLIFY